MSSKLTRRRLLELSLAGAATAVLVEACLQAPGGAPPTGTPTAMPAPTLPPVDQHPERATTSSPYGVGFGANELQPQTPAALSQAAEAHVGWIRVGLYWQEIEPTAGDYHWAAYDSLLAEARQNSLNVLAILAYSTPWCTTAPSNPSWNPTHYPPEDMGDWQSYVAAVVARYKDQVHHWEVWNEPDLPQFWAGSAAEYARLLAVTYATIKQVDPTATVVLGGLAFVEQDGQPAAAFLKRLLSDPESPVGDNFDVAAMHFYLTLDELPSRVGEFKATLTEAGLSDRPFWMTEAGLPSDPSLSASGVDGQSEWLAAALPALLGTGASRVFWFQLFEDAWDTRGFGLLDSQLRPRPALTALAQLAQPSSPSG
jgi:large repetitive protein